MEKLKINLDIILPDVPDERDACIERLIQKMQRHKGVEKVHIQSSTDNSPAHLCFHYNADLISLEQVERYAKVAGAEILDQYGHLLTDTQGLRDMNQAQDLEESLRKLTGIKAVAVAGSGSIRIEFDRRLTNKEELLSTIKDHGRQVNGNFKIVGEQKAEHDHDDHDHGHGNDASGWKTYLPAGLSLLMLIIGIITDQFLNLSYFTGWLRFGWYALAYIPVGWPVVSRGIKTAFKGDLFTEFMLMGIATLGAFSIGEYPEGVAVMLFYTIGELFQDAAVNRAKRNIKSLLDIRPKTANVLRDNRYLEVNPEAVTIGEIIQIKPGEKVPLDGEMISESSSFNTAALTGESMPNTFMKGQTVLAGMINQEKLVELKVTRLFSDSSLARILVLVQEASTRKAKTEQFIRKFSRIYTPVVVLLAVSIIALPYFFVPDYIFRNWLYRALVFLVVSCPCALVISIPLGYFGGIGAASRTGILFKGSNFLDLMTKVNLVVMDKTGTLTKGVFKVAAVKSFAGEQEEWLPLAATLEAKSTHPAAQAVVAYAGQATFAHLAVSNLEEIAGHGVKGLVENKEVLVGNSKLLKKFNIHIPDDVTPETDTVIWVAVDHQLAGLIIIADEIKADSQETIAALHQRNVETVMLSGDRQSVVNKVAKELGIDQAFGDLLPENKVKMLEDFQKDGTKTVAFVGDGVNDAPVLALADVGIAMGGLGSDAAIETADVIIQTDQPSKILKAIAIGRATNQVVWQNITLAFVVKAAVLILGAGGIATMWEAVFADVGVAMLAILNAVRIQRMKF
ncbi:MAG: heavy metal translocating P-type ATPase [Sphingobacteriaceae bacterium]